MLRIFHKNFGLLAVALTLLCFSASRAPAASKPHIITFGKWTTVACPFESARPETRERPDKPLTLKIRSLLVDARVKEFTLGSPHEITDRLFVVRRAFRLNDSLPQELNSLPHWQWQRGGWLLVDRTTGRISAIDLPEFDPVYSTASWYRDYAAYCGVSDDGKTVFAVVAEINRRKPVLKKILEGTSITQEEQNSTSLESVCAIPAWQRSPTRVTFPSAGAAEQTFAVRGHIVDLVGNEEDEAEEEAAK
jgi:hypothetical protein